MMRNANSGSCSIVRSEPNATVARKHAVVDRSGAAVEDEQRLVGRDEVADLRHELDDPVGSLRLAHQRVQVDREHDLGVTVVTHDPARRPGSAEGMVVTSARRPPDSDRPP